MLVEKGDVMDTVEDPNGRLDVVDGDPGVVEEAVGH